MPSAERLRQLLAASPGLAPTILDVEDVSDGCGAKFEVVVVSDAFAVSELGRGRPRARLLARVRASTHAGGRTRPLRAQGKKLLERHRQVHEALGADMGAIHALALKTWTPEQYAAKKEQAAQEGAA